MDCWPVWPERGLCRLAVSHAGHQWASNCPCGMALIWNWTVLGLEGSAHDPPLHLGLQHTKSVTFPQMQFWQLVPKLFRSTDGWPWPPHYATFFEVGITPALMVHHISPFSASSSVRTLALRKRRDDSASPPPVSCGSPGGSGSQLMNHWSRLWTCYKEGWTTFNASEFVRGGQLVQSFISWPGKP